MTHLPTCTDPVMLWQPQIRKGLPITGTCKSCGAIEIRTPARHRVGEVCRNGNCCDPDNLPRQWKAPRPQRKNAPTPTRPTPRTTSEDPHHAH